MPQEVPAQGTGPQPGLPVKGIWVGLLGLGAFAALAGGFLLVRKLMDTQLPKVQKVGAAAPGPGLCVIAWEFVPPCGSLAHMCRAMCPSLTVFSSALQAAVICLALHKGLQVTLTACVLQAVAWVVRGVKLK